MNTHPIEPVPLRSEIIHGRDSAEEPKARVWIGEREPVTVSYARLTTLWAEMLMPWAEWVREVVEELGDSITDVPEPARNMAALTPERVQEDALLNFYRERAEARDDVGAIPVGAPQDGRVVSSRDVIVWIAGQEDAGPLRLSLEGATNLSGRLRNVADTLADIIIEQRGGRARRRSLRRAGSHVVTPERGRRDLRLAPTDAPPTLWTETLLFLCAGRVRFSEHTVENYRVPLFRLCRFLPSRGVEAWREVERADLRAWLKAETESLGLCGRSVRRNLSAVRSFLRWLRAEGKIERDPAHGMRGPRMEHRLPDVPSEAEMSAVLDRQNAEAESGAFLAVRDLALIETFYSTGARLSEVIGMSVSDVEWRPREGRADVLVNGKGEKERWVPLGRPATAALRRWLRVRRREAKPGVDALFIGRHGRGLTPSGVRLRVQRAFREATGEERGPHVLRHACATHLFEHGAGIMALCEHLGHADVTTTLYVRLSRRKLKQTYDEAHPRA